MDFNCQQPVIEKIVCLLRLIFNITQKPKSYAVFLSIVWVALKTTDFGASVVALKRASCVARSQ